MDGVVIPVDLVLVDTKQDLLITRHVAFRYAVTAAFLGLLH